MGINTVMDSSYPEGKTNAAYILFKCHFFQEVGIPLLEVIIANSNHNHRVGIVLSAFTALSFVTEPITPLTLPAAVEHLLAIGATQRSGFATATACSFHDEDKPGDEQTGYTMFHRIVKREKIPIMIRTDPRFQQPHDRRDLQRLLVRLQQVHEDKKPASHAGRCPDSPHKRVASVVLNQVIWKDYGVRENEKVTLAVIKAMWLAMRATLTMENLNPFRMLFFVF